MMAVQPPLNLRVLLQQYWGFANFRPGQEQIINAVVAGQDVLALMPTGGGKSLCYHIAGLARQTNGKGLTIVISPLIALMDDQVAALRQRGIRAGAIHAGIDSGERSRLLYQAGQGELDFLYLAPERLESDLVRGPLHRWPVVLLAVDEAHCISQWGYDFRPAYRRIREVQNLLSHVPVLALTATATPPVRQDILVQLGLRKPLVHSEPFLRPNLRYAVVQNPDRMAALVKALSKVPGTAIVYTRSRRLAEQLANDINQHGIAAAAYHAGLPQHIRQAVQQDWMQGRARVVVATTAFGMGIDKAEVRLVLHWHLPDNLESYYQEAGRAGRDGHLAYALLLYEPSEAQRLQRQSSQAWPDDWKSAQQLLSLVYDAARLSVGQVPEPAAVRINLADLAAQAGIPAPAANRLLLWLGDLGYLKLQSAQEGTGDMALQWKQDPEALRRLAESHPVLDPILDHALRQLGPAARYAAQPVPLTAWAVQLGLPDAELHRRLERMAQLGWLRLAAKDGQVLITFLQPRPQRWTQHVLHWDALQALREADHSRLQALRQYLDSTAVCRQLLLRRYFGEATSDTCGQCDICLGRVTQPAPPNRPARKTTRQINGTDSTPKQAERQVEPPQVDPRVAVEQALLSALAAGPQSYTRLLERVAVGDATLRVAVLRTLAHAGRIRIGSDYQVSLVAA